MREYLTKPLRQGASLASGGTPSKSNPAYWGGTIPWLTPKDMAQFDGSTADYITAEAVGNGTRKAPAGAIFIAVRGMSLHNEIRIVRPHHEMAFNQDIKAITPNDTIDGSFLYYALLANVPGLLNAVEAAGHGTGVLPTDHLNDLPIPAIPLPDQRAIASVLGALDDKIALNRRMNATLEAMARALFRDWFVDFGPTRAKEAKEPPTLAPDLWPLFPARLNENGIPEGWERRTLGELVNLTIGRTPPRKEKEHFLAGGEGIPWLSIKTMGDLQTFAYETEESLTPVAVRKFRIPLVKKGTVLVSFKLTVGRVAIAAQDMTTNEAIAHLQPNGSRSVPDEFLYCAMKEFDFKRLGSTSSIATAVNSKMLRGLPLVVPEHAMLEAFSSTTEPLFRRIEANNRESRTLARIRDLLLPRLMSGELRVNDAEEQIEEVL